jgi:hypothetical protein
LAAALTLDAILVSFAVRPLDHAFPLTIFHVVFAFDVEDTAGNLCDC